MADGKDYSITGFAPVAKPPGKFHKSREAFEAEALLSAGKPGDVITPGMAYARLGIPCDGSKCRGWQVIAYCIPRIERQSGLCWRWDRIAKLWKCLTDIEKPADMSARVRRINSHARRNERVLDTIDLANLPEAERRAAVVLGSVSSMARMISGRKATKTLEMFAGDTPQVPDQSVLMRLFVK